MFGIDLSVILAFATGILTGTVAALKVISAATKTKVDDKVLEVAENVLEILPKNQK